ncbi:unnamed protein product [Jaminaea pallidilutea]
MSSQAYVALGQTHARTTLEEDVLKEYAIEENVSREHAIIFDTEQRHGGPLRVQSSPALERPAWSSIGDLPTFLPALEGMRGVAVLLTHLRHISQEEPSLGMFTKYIGFGGVSMFFVLSGFLITGTLQQMQKEGRSKGRFSHLGRFYMARNIRLYPALFIMVATTTIIVEYWSDWTPRHNDLVRSVLALCYMTNLEELFGVIGGMHINTWSLAVEEQFYIAWSLTLPWMTELSPRNRALILTLLILASGVINTGTIPGPPWLFGFLSLSANVWKMAVGASLRLLPLPRVVYSRHMAHVGLACLAVLILSPLVSATRVFVAPIAPVLSVIFAASVIMVSVAGGEAARFPLLESEALRFTGRISYGWYLWQLPM